MLLVSSGILNFITKGLLPSPEMSEIADLSRSFLTGSSPGTSNSDLSAGSSSFMLSIFFASLCGVLGSSILNYILLPVSAVKFEKADMSFALFEIGDVGSYCL